jgi:hypothetical protein
VAYALCAYCASESFVDLGGALLHQVIRVAVPRARLPGLIKARALEAGHDDVSLANLQLSHEPVWEIESPDGRRLAISARPGPEGRFEEFRLPGGERGFVDPGTREADAEWLEPELAPESVAEVAARATGRPVAVKTLRLVHHPVYKGRLIISDESFDFHLDAVSGELLDIDWPARPSYRNRNRAWLAGLAMVAVATLLPLPIAAIAALLIGGFTAWMIQRPRSAGGPLRS